MIRNKVNNHERKIREDPDDFNIKMKGLNKTKMLYRKAVGSLLYLTITNRSDVSYAINILSRDQLNPIQEAWEMVIRVLEYFIFTMNRKLVYKSEGDDLQLYSDASFADCKDSVTTSVLEN